MQSKNVAFPNAEGQSLAGILDLPADEPVAWAIFAHCFTCSKNLKAASHVSRALVDEGIAVLRFDFTGLGQSEGAFGETTFSTNVADLVAAASWLGEEYCAPDILVGHSLGGTAALQAALHLPDVVAVATIGSPADPGHVTHLFAGSEEELRESGAAEVRLGGRPFLMKRDFLDDLERHNLPNAISGLRKALLVMHAPLDVGRVLAAWASRYLPSPAGAEAPQAEPDEVVARTLKRGFRTMVVAGDHALVADEPRSAGGTDTGPTPYDLLAAALARSGVGDRARHARPGACRRLCGLRAGGRSDSRIPA